MKWYLAPKVDQAYSSSDPDEEFAEVTVVPEYHGPGTGGVPWDSGTQRYVVHAYSDTQCLVGFYDNDPAVPGDWTEQTVAEARAYFSTTKGRAATVREIP